MFARLSHGNVGRLVLSRLVVVSPARASATSSALTQIEEEKQKALAALEEELPQPKVYPERDLVNFPRQPRPVYPGKIRLGFAPEEWFQFFYKKTGVTGPYVFGLGLVTFLLSKELYVLEEEFSTGLTIFIMSYAAIKKFGPSARAWVEKCQKEDLDGMYAKKEDAIKAAEAGIEQAKKEVVYAKVRDSLIAAKRENVHMQLEAEYRSRMMHAYQQVKKRLDYMLDTDSTRRQFEQKHMVDWVISNVMKSITAQQEKEAMQKCIENLKALSARAA